MTPMADGRIRRRGLNLESVPHCLRLTGTMLIMTSDTGNTLIAAVSAGQPTGLI